MNRQLGLLLISLFAFGCNDTAITGFDPSSTPPELPTEGVDGTYIVAANPNQQACGNLGTTTFYSASVTITTSGNTIYADWGLDQITSEYTEPVGSMTGARFLLNWTYSHTGSDGFTTDYANQWHGDFTGNGLVSHLEQDLLIQGGLVGQCDLLWQVEGAKM